MVVERLVAIVTQLGECQTEDLEAAGSSPAYRTFLFIRIQFRLRLSLLHPLCLARPLHGGVRQSFPLWQ